MADVQHHIIEEFEDFELKPTQREDLRELLELCHENLDQVDDDLITRAFRLCYLSHKGVTRASGEPFYLHPVEVAKIVATDLTIDAESSEAALLHDTVEDTAITLEEIGRASCRE